VNLHVDDPPCTCQQDHPTQRGDQAADHLINGVSAKFNAPGWLAGELAESGL
jgi:hypothetical protein